MILFHICSSNKQYIFCILYTHINSEIDIESIVITSYEYIISMKKYK